MKYGGSMQLGTEKQRKMFFALGHQLGYEPEKLKASAKKHFKLASLKDATKDQMKWLIDQLLNEQEKI